MDAIRGSPHPGCRRPRWSAHPGARGGQAPLTTVRSGKATRSTGRHRSACGLRPCRFAASASRSTPTPSRGPSELACESRADSLMAWSPIELSATGWPDCGAPTSRSSDAFALLKPNDVAHRRRSSRQRLEARRVHTDDRSLPPHQHPAQPALRAATWTAFKFCRGESTWCERVEGAGGAGFLPLAFVAHALPHVLRQHQSSDSAVGQATCAAAFGLRREVVDWCLVTDTFFDSQRGFTRTIRRMMLAEADRVEDIDMVVVT